MRRPRARPGAGLMAPKVSLSGHALLIAFDLMVRFSLRGVWVRGEVPDGAVVWATNHHHWWDAFAANAILRTRGLAPTVLLSAANLESFGLFRLIDAVPASESHRAVPLLRQGRPLVIMPEGRMVGPGPLGPIRPGAARLADEAGVPLVPVALRVVVRAHQHAEVFVDIGPPVPGAELQTAMSAHLAGLDDTIASSDPDAPLPGYRLVVGGRRSIHQWVAARTVQRRG